MQGRPYGGTAILWTDNLMASVERVGTHCRRLCAVKGTINNTCIMLCNAYLPSNPDKDTNKLEDFAEVISSVSSVLADTDIDYVMFGG